MYIYNTSKENLKRKKKHEQRDENFFLNLHSVIEIKVLIFTATHLFTLKNMKWKQNF